MIKMSDILVATGTITVIFSLYIAFNGIIYRMNELFECSLHQMNSYYERLLYRVKKRKRDKIDEIKTEVLHSSDMYEPNDVLDIIDKITDIIESEG